MEVRNTKEVPKVHPENVVILSYSITLTTCQDKPATLGLMYTEIYLFKQMFSPGLTTPATQEKWRRNSGARVQRVNAVWITLLNIYISETISMV